MVHLLNMIWQQGVETVTSLVPVQDMSDGKYMPALASKEPFTIENFTIVCQSLKVNHFYKSGQ